MWGWGWARGEKETPGNNKDELKAMIKAAFTNLNKKTVEKACRRFRNRLVAVFEAYGDFFE